jgi:YD repeat-containing protein
MKIFKKRTLYLVLEFLLCAAVFLASCATGELEGTSSDTNEKGTKAPSAQTTESATTKPKKTEEKTTDSVTTESNTTEPTTDPSTPLETEWLLIKQTAYKPRGTEKGNQIIEYTYDQNGFLVKKEYSWPGGSVFNRYTYTNDEIGDALSIVQDSYTFNQSVTTVYNIKRDAQGRIIEKHLNGTTSYLKYEYDEEGSLVEYRYEYYDYNGNLNSGEKIIYKNGNEYQTYVYNTATGWILSEEYFYDNNGFLSSSTHYWYTSGNGYYNEGSYNGSNSHYTFYTVSYSATYTCDTYGNVISESIPSPYGTETYSNEYMTLDEYRQKGLCENGSGDSNSGTSKCLTCKEQGYNRCQGHNCIVCEGAGELTCAGCHGTGKKYGKDCPVCYGAKTQICPNCKGARKEFFD